VIAEVGCHFLTAFTFPSSEAGEGELGADSPLGEQGSRVPPHRSCLKSLSFRNSDICPDHSVTGALLGHRTSITNGSKIFKNLSYLPFVLVSEEIHLSSLDSARPTCLTDFHLPEGEPTLEEGLGSMVGLVTGMLKL